MNHIAIIGGSGFATLAGLKIIDKFNPETPWGLPSAPIIVGEYHHKTLLFLARHGVPHTIAPHKINYRANIYALKEAGADRIIGINAVGGITTNMSPRAIVIPDQLIDYSHSRIDTFYQAGETVTHIDFTEPYSASLRATIMAAAQENQLAIINKGTYAVTQGPRLETAAEIKRLEKDGCDIVGMTGMPEASLSRELNIDYACCALVVNWAAGKTDDIITMQIIQNNLTAGLNKIERLIHAILDQS